MKKIFTILILSSLFAGELEVEGDLKVSGNIDAQNNPIKNVGIPQELTDAINGNVLQDALRDDGPFEYKFVATRFDHGELLPNGSDFSLSYKNYGENNWIDNFEDYLNTLSNEGWTIYKIFPYTYASSYGFNYNYFILQKLITE